MGFNTRLNFSDIVNSCKSSHSDKLLAKSERSRFQILGSLDVPIPIT